MSLTLYTCGNCGCEIGGVMAALRATTDGCPMCGNPDCITSNPEMWQGDEEMIDLGAPVPAIASDTQEMPAVFIDPNDDEIPF